MNPDTRPSPPSESTADLRSVLLQNGLFRLRMARGVTLAVIEDVPVEKWCYHPVPAGNHVLWILGHLAMTDELFLNQLGPEGPRCPESWAGLFGMGSKPLGDAGAYPDPTVLREHLDQRRHQLEKWFESLSEAELLDPLPESFRFAPNRAELMPSIAWHEAWHGGQLAVVRKALGLASKFG